MSRTGRLGNVTFGKESTWGTGVSTTNYLRVSSESLVRTVEHAEDPSLVSEIYTTDMIKVGDGIGGGIEGVIHGDDIGYLFHGVLGNQSALGNPVLSRLLVGYNGTSNYARLTKSGDSITAEIRSTSTGSWTPDTNFGTGTIDVSAAANDTLAELQLIIAGYTGYDCVIFGNSTDSTTLDDFAATSLRTNDILVGGLLMDVTTTSTVAKMHTIIPAAAGTNLPSFTYLMNRTLGTNKSVQAAGCKVSNISLSNTAKDLCKYSITIDGKIENVDQTDSALSVPTVEGYLAANVKIVMEEEDGTLTELDEVKDYSITINANVDDNRVIGSYYKKEQIRQNSTIEYSFTANNTSTQYDLRDNYTGDSLVGFYIYFKGNDYADTTNVVPYQILIRIPASKLTDYNSPLSTPDRLVISGAGTVVKPIQSTYGEHIYCYVVDANVSSY